MLHEFHHDFEEKLFELIKSKQSLKKEHYITSAQQLKEHILPNIKAVESQLTDHGEEHVHHVMQQAFNILKPHNYLTSYDWYIMAFGIMFHDSGNIEGRLNHGQKINYALQNYAQCLGQSGSRIVREIVAAHSGNSDTIQQVSQHAAFNSEPINAREVAAIIRFADELAEGSCRTSITQLDKVVDNPESLLHHAYSHLTEINVSSPDNTIYVYYYPHVVDQNGTKIVQIKSNDSTIGMHAIDFKEYLSFTAKRLHKLNTERKYTSMYSPAIATFNRVKYTFNFEGDVFDTVGDELNDFALPGSNNTEELEASLQALGEKIFGGAHDN